MYHLIICYKDIIKVAHRLTVGHLVNTVNL